MNRQQVLEKLEKAWSGLQEAYAGLSEKQMIEPGTLGEWSVKDILAHVTTWEQEALKYMPWILEERQPPRYVDQYGGLNAFNHQMAELKRSLPLAQVLRQMEESHQQVVDFVRQAPEEQFATDTRFRRRLRLDTYSHYAEHARAIREWRARQAD